MIQIKNKFTGAVILKLETLVGANLTDANLSGADLTDANLTDANLSGADLTDAYLYYTKLSGAYMLIESKKIEIKSNIKLEFQFNRHLAVYFGGFIRIGCEYHSLKYWLANFRELGTKAKYTKSEINAYGCWLKSITDIVDKT